MITMNAAFARVRRAIIHELAGDKFLLHNEIFEHIPYLRSKSKEQFLFGIYENSAKWTVVSVRKLFACNGSTPFELVLNKETDQIYQFIRNVGIKHFSDIYLEGGRCIWINTAPSPSRRNGRLATRRPRAHPR